MNKEEFIENLRKALSVSLDHETVNKHIAYYEEYIMMELKNKKSEEEILNLLGDPRLLAKTIINTNQENGRTVQSEYTNQENDNSDTYYEKQNKYTKMKSKLIFWFILILICVCLFFILKIAATLFFRFLPFIIVGGVVLYLIKLFQKK